MLDDDIVRSVDASTRRNYAESERTRTREDRCQSDRLYEDTRQREHDDEEYEQTPSGTAREPATDRFRAAPRLHDGARHRRQWKAEAHVQERIIGHRCILQPTQGPPLPTAQRGVPNCRSAATHFASPRRIGRLRRPASTAVVLPPTQKLKPSSTAIARWPGQTHRDVSDALAGRRGQLLMSDLPRPARSPAWRCAT